MSALRFPLCERVSSRIHAFISRSQNTRAACVLGAEDKLSY